jgi:hypothetical protein
MIPTNLQNPAQIRLLQDYLREELRDAQNARKPLEERWNRWDRAYRCEPDEEQKNFPFEGAANLVLPVIATDVDIIFARLMGVLLAPSNLWSVTARRPEMSDIAPRIQEFLEWAQENEIRPYDPICDFVLEICKKGTGVLKQRYTRDMKKVYEWRELDQGVWQQQAQLLLHDHPSLHHVSLEDFYIPAYASDIQNAPWVAERIMLTYPQYLDRVKAGIYTGNDRFTSWYANNRGPSNEQEKMRLDRYVPNFGKRFEFFEYWTDFDVSGDGERVAVVCTYHKDSDQLVRLDFNPFFNQDKPYSVARYMRQEKRFYGIGLEEMLDQFQEEISTQHNQRLDNATLANTTAFKSRKDARLPEFLPVFPGKNFQLDNMDDLQPMPLGQKYDSTIQNEQQSLTYARRRDGVDDYVAGASSPSIGYAAAFTTQAMMGAASKRFDQTHREIHNALSESGTRLLELYQQFNQRGKEFVALGPEDGALVHQVLQFPLDLIRRGLKVSVTATDVATSKDMQIRTNQMIMQQLMMFYQQYMQAMSYIVNPQIPPQIKQLTIEMIQGGSILMRRILDASGVQDAAKMVPQLEGILNGQQSQLGNIQTALASLLNGGGAAVPPSVGGVPGVAGVPTGSPPQPLALPAGPQGL